MSKFAVAANLFPSWSGKQSFERSVGRAVRVRSSEAANVAEALYKSWQRGFLRRSKWKFAKRKTAGRGKNRLAKLREVKVIRTATRRGDREKERGEREREEGVEERERGKETGDERRASERGHDKRAGEWMSESELEYRSGALKLEHTACIISDTV